MQTVLIFSAVLLVAVTASELDQCPEYCTCEDNGFGSSYKATCSKLDASQQYFNHTFQHLIVEVDPSAQLSLPDYIFANLNLRRLEYIHIVNTALTNVSEHAFSGLEQLYHVNLANNQIILLHPDTFVNNSNLHTLKLNGNPLTLTQVLKSSQNYLLRSATLTELYLSNCQLSQISPKFFSEQRKLIVVDMSNNTLKNIPTDTFYQLMELEDLDLSSNKISKLDINTFVHNVELSTLKLANNPISSLNGLNSSSLDELDMSLCKLSILMAETFKGMPGLSTLNLANNEISVISDDTFNSFKELANLDLSNNKIVGPLPSDLFKNNNDLKNLKLSGNRDLIELVSDTGFVNSCKALNKLEVDNCGLMRLVAGQLSGMDKLIHLNVSNNFIRTIEKNTFEKLKLLQSLDLSNNKLLSLNPNIFSNNQRLIRLHISGNPLKSLPPFVFTHTPILKFLRAGNCSLEQIWSTNKEDMIKNNILKQLVHFDLSNNYIQSINTSDFISMSVLEVVELNGNPLECVKNNIEVINDFEQKKINPYQPMAYHDNSSKFEWMQMKRNICKEKEILVPIPQTSAKDIELVEEEDDSGATEVSGLILLYSAEDYSKWELLFVFVLAALIVLFSVHTFCTISKRKISTSAAQTYIRPDLGGQVKTRNVSGEPTYYKLYEECSVPKESEKSTYILDLSRISAILKKATPVYKKVVTNKIEINI